MGSSQSGPKITSQDKAILDLKIQRDRLRQYQKRVEGILEQEKQAAKEALQKGHKERALLALRRRKYQENLLTQTDQQLSTLQDLVSQIEFSLVEKDVIYGLKQGNSVLTQLNKEMSLENVERLMSDTADAVAYQREVDEMLQSHMSAEEEDAVQSELADLQKQLGMDQEAPKVNLPDAPRTELPKLSDAEPSGEPPAVSSRPERVALEA